MYVPSEAVFSFGIAVGVFGVLVLEWLVDRVAGSDTVLRMVSAAVREWREGRGGADEH